MTKRLSIAQAWIKSCQLARERQLALAFGHKAKAQKLESHMKRTLGIVIDRGLEKRH